MSKEQETEATVCPRCKGRKQVLGWVCYLCYGTGVG